MTNLYLMCHHHHRDCPKRVDPIPQSISRRPSPEQITLRVLIGAVVYLCLIGNRQSSTFTLTKKKQDTYRAAGAGAAGAAATGTGGSATAARHGDDGFEFEVGVCFVMWSIWKS
jgi:hypothetical protein